MCIQRVAITVAVLILASACQTSGLRADAAKSCRYCEPWNEAQTPFVVFGNTWYVGTRGLSALLLTSAEGHILIDGGLAQSAPLITANIRALGFDPRDVRLIVNSHPHFDHAGGLAALKRDSGARVAASPAAAAALRRGGPGRDDPQYGFGIKANGFAPIASVTEVADGEVLRVGPLRLRAHFTPGHSAGGTTWSWQSCDNGRCLDIVYADSVNPVSTPEFRYSDSRSEFISFERLRASIATIAALPCDIVLSPHPFYFAMQDKLIMREKDTSADAFVDPNGCRAYAAESTRRLNQRRAEENTAP